jgi:glycosyltransferase 2 family protein
VETVRSTPDLEVLPGDGPPPFGAGGKSGRMQVWKDRLQRLAVKAQAWQRRAPRVVAVLRIIYLPAALALVAYIGYDAAGKIDLSTIRVWPLVFAYGTAVVWWVALAAGWSTLITERVRAVPLAAWCKTQVARYLPGGFWAPLVRATTVPGRVRDKAAAVAAENVIVLAAAVGVGALWATVHNPAWLPLALVILLPVSAGRWLERRTKVTRVGVARTSSVYAVGFVAYGVTAILTQLSVSGVRHPTYPLYVAAAACVAWAAGLVVVFAPSGVGVREVVYVWVLRGLYPRADLQAAAITTRLVTVLAELTVLAIVSLPFWRPDSAPADAASPGAVAGTAVAALPD